MSADENAAQGFWSALGDRGRLFDPSSWSLLTNRFRGRAKALSLIAVLGVLQSAAALPTLAFVRYAFDVAVPKAAILQLVFIGLALMVLRLASSALALWSRALSLNLTKRAIRDLRSELLATLYTLPKDFFGRNDAAKVQTRIVQETERLDNLTSLLLSAILPALLASALLGAALLYLNWRLVLLLALLGPPVVAATLLGGRFVRREVKAFQGAFERFSQGVQFVLRQMDLTRVRGFEAQELERQTAAARDLETSGVRMAMSFAIHGQIQTNLVGMGGLLLLVGGGLAVAHHTMSMGDLLAFFLAAGLLNQNLSRVLGVAPDLIAGAESLAKLTALRHEAPQSAYAGSTPHDFQGHLELRDVSFGYGATPLVRHASFCLVPARVVALVGPNGAGKSTLVNLLLGYYRPDAGQVLADGVAYEKIDLRRLRRSIGVVLQRPTFFTGTIAENVGYGWPGVSPEELQDALEVSGAAKFVNSLPNGADTLIGEGGVLVSGGEAQKLAIARALVGSPRLLILDEPTNHLDAASVGQIMGRISAGSGRPAVLVISHDPSVIQFCDDVLRLDEGQVNLSQSPPPPDQAA